MNVHCTCVYHILLILIHIFFCQFLELNNPYLLFTYSPVQLDPVFHIPAHMQSQCQCSGYDSHYIMKLNIIFQIQVIWIINICNSDCNRLTLACFWNTWCTAWTFSPSKTWCTTLHGALIRKCHTSEFSLILYVNDISFRELNFEDNYGNEMILLI